MISIVIFPEVYYNGLYKVAHFENRIYKLCDYLHRTEYFNKAGGAVDERKANPNKLRVYRT